MPCGPGSLSSAKSLSKQLETPYGWLGTHRAGRSPQGHGTHKSIGSRPAPSTGRGERERQRRSLPRAHSRCSYPSARGLSGEGQLCFPAVLTGAVGHAWAGPAPCPRWFCWRARWRVSTPGISRRGVVHSTCLGVAWTGLLGLCSLSFVLISGGKKKPEHRTRGKWSGQLTLMGALV